MDNPAPVRLCRLESHWTAILWLALGVGCLLFPVGGPAETPPAFATQGQTEEAVLESLGSPTGRMRQGDKIVWLYPRGTVEFIGGVVVRQDLLSDEAYARERARRDQWAEAWQKAVSSTNASAVSLSGEGSFQGKEGSAGAVVRYRRPFVRPDYPTADRHNSIPVVFDVALWPPGMREIYDASVQIPVETGQRRTTLQTLVYELKKYPDEMLEQTLRCIYMVRDVRGSGANRDPAGLAFYTEGIILEHTYILHHEYAHELNLLFHDSFPARQIAAVSGPYKGYRDEQRLHYKKLWELGYASNYAMCSVQEDFAEFCGELYLQPDAFFQAMQEHPKLEEKFSVIRPFLEDVKLRTTGDTTPMDRAYFSRFDRTRWRP